MGKRKPTTAAEDEGQEVAGILDSDIDSEGGCFVDSPPTTCSTPDVEECIPYKSEVSWNPPDLDALMTLLLLRKDPTDQSAISVETVIDQCRRSTHVDPKILENLTHAASINSEGEVDNVSSRPASLHQDGRRDRDNEQVRREGQHHTNANSSSRTHSMATRARSRRSSSASSASSSSPASGVFVPLKFSNAHHHHLHHHHHHHHHSSSRRISTPSPNPQPTRFYPHSYPPQSDWLKDEIRRHGAAITPEDYEEENENDTPALRTSRADSSSQSRFFDHRPSPRPAKVRRASLDTGIHHFEDACTSAHSISTATPARRSQQQHEQAFQAAASAMSALQQSLRSTSLGDVEGSVANLRQNIGKLDDSVRKRIRDSLYSLSQASSASSASSVSASASSSAPAPSPSPSTDTDAHHGVLRLLYSSLPLTFNRASRLSDTPSDPSTSSTPSDLTSSLSANVSPAPLFQHHPFSCSSPHHRPGSPEAPAYIVHKPTPRRRIFFTDEQKIRLNTSFAIHDGGKLTPSDIYSIAAEVGITEHQVRIYFQNKRARSRDKKIATDK